MPSCCGIVLASIETSRVCSGFSRIIVLIFWVRSELVFIYEGVSGRACLKKLSRLV